MHQHLNWRRPRRIERERVRENICRDSKKKFSNVGKEIVTQVQEVQRVSYSINPRRSTLRHMLIKLTKIKYKEKILETGREKQKITYKGIPIRLSADFSAETQQARRQWQDIFKVLRSCLENPRDGGAWWAAVYVVAQSRTRLK